MLNRNQAKKQKTKFKLLFFCYFPAKLGPEIRSNGSGSTSARLSSRLPSAPLPEPGRSGFPCHVPGKASRARWDRRGAAGRADFKIK